MPFDVACPTVEETHEVLRGFSDAISGRMPEIQGGAYGHGYRVGLFDRMGAVCNYQIEDLMRIRSRGIKWISTSQEK